MVAARGVRKVLIHIMLLLLLVSWCGDVLAIVAMVLDD